MNSTFVLEVPEGQSPERTAYIDRLRAEIFGINTPTTEAFVADAPDERFSTKTARNKLRRLKLSPRN